MKEPKAKMVLIYAHKNRNFLDCSALLGFLQSLSKHEGWDFWWDEKMNHPLFDEEIKRQLGEADIIVALVSQEFLNSDYITNVESKIANKRLREEGILIVPVMLDASRAEYEDWLEDIHHFPKAGYLRTSRSKNEVFLEITKYISSWYHGRALPFRSPEMIYKLRNLSETVLSKEQIRILRRDSCNRARKMVPNEELREEVSKAARALKDKNKGNPLNKRQLELLDKKFLAGKARKPDAEIARWILRCVGLHPQGKVLSRSK